MPKNFDDARRKREQQTREEREFVLGGETFYAKMAVRPEVLARWNDISEDMDLKQVLTITDEVILALLESVDNTFERYTAVRANEEDPIPLSDLLEVAQWLVEVQTGRPIEPPSVSGGSAPSELPTGTPSTDDSPSPDTPEAQAA